MNELGLVLNYLTIALIIGLPSIGVAIGQSLSARQVLAEIDTQPSARNEISRAMILGLAITETATVLGIVIALVLLFEPSFHSGDLPQAIARFGIAPALGLSSLITGLISYLPIQQAAHAIGRQPFFSQKIANLLLISQSLLQTPIIFGFIISWFIHMQSSSVINITDAIRLLSCGLAIGIGSIGPVFGLAIFSKTVITGLGINRKAYFKLLTFTFFSQAIIETPVLFSFVISLLLALKPITEDSFIRSMAMLSAALCIGIGTIFPSINSGKISATAANVIAQRPESYSMISRSSMFAQALIDSFAIYSLLIAFIMLVMR